MHEPAGVVENLVQNSTEYPYSAIQFQNTPPPPKMKIVRNLGTLTFQLQNTPPTPSQIQISNFFPKSKSEVAEYPPPKLKIVRNLGTLTFQLQNTPPENENCQKSWLFDFSVAEYPPRKWKLSEILALWLFSCRIPPQNPNFQLFS